MTRKIPWLGTNWKMHKNRAEAHRFAEALKASAFANSALARLFIIPPMPYVEGVAEIMRGTNVKIGVQNMHWADQGAYTGEVSPLMVKEIGATLAEIGHSERRQHFNETDDGVARKTAAAVRHGLMALVCIGDTRAEYDAGAAGDALARQTRFALRDVGKAAIGNVVLAYEPVWSIGESGIPADPDFANAQHRHIKEVSADVLGEPLPVVYGGSVNPQNCLELISKSDIDGLFIGRSAWEPAGFIGIIDAVIKELGEPRMKIALGADSAGKPLIDAIEAHLKAKGQHEVTNLSKDGYYADMASGVAREVKAGRFERAVLCCGTGIGVAISANKVPGIRAAQTHDTYSAERAAKSNNAQIITMGARVIGPELAKAIVDTWLASEFDPKGASAANVEAINKLDGSC